VETFKRLKALLSLICRFKSAKALDANAMGNMKDGEHEAKVEDS
jgi:hypothetical protein